MRLLAIGCLMLVVGLAQAQCNHPYYPVKEGRKLTYSTLFEGQSSTYSIAFEKVSAKGFTARTTVGDTSFTAQYTCSNNQIGRVNVQVPGMEGFAMKTTSSNGFFMPAANLLRPGYTWNEQQTFEMSGGGMDLKGSLKTQSRVLAIETVTVKAGRFQAIKIEQTSTFSLGTPSNNPPSKSVAWFAQGVGLIKQQGDGGSMELISIK